MSAGLKGRRVLVTRPAHQAEKLAALLRSHGAEVQLLPMLEVLPPEDAEPLRLAIRNLGAYRWVVFTSANAVSAVGAELDRQEMNLAEFQDLRIAVVGEETAHALAAVGREADIVPENATAISLAAALAPVVSGQAVLLPQQPGASVALADALEGAGAMLHRVDAYRTTTPGDAGLRLRALYAGVDTVPEVLTFTSAQSARNFFELLGRAGISLPAETVIGSIGPTTTEALKSLGVAPQVEATKSTAQSLADGLNAYFA